MSIIVRHGNTIVQNNQQQVIIPTPSPWYGDGATFAYNSNPTYVTKDGGNNVSTWIDQSNSNDISQGVGVQQPNWVDGSGLQFTNANSDYLSFSNTSAYDFQNNDFTISFWFNCLSNPTPIGDVYLNLFSIAGSILVFHYLEGSDTIYYFFNRNDGGFKNGTVTATMLQDTWYHYAFCGDSTWMYMYVDGVLKDKFSTVGFLALSTHTFAIGWAQNASRYFEGYIDNFVVKNGTNDYDGSAYSVGQSVFTPPTRGY